MLRLVSLRLHDFGPFKGEQTLTFPSDDGGMSRRMLESGLMLALLPSSHRLGVYEPNGEQHHEEDYHIECSDFHGH